MGNCISHAQRPRTPEQEKKAVAEVMEDVENEGYRHMQRWNVISAKWWRTWKEYSGYCEDNDDDGGGGGRANSRAARNSSEQQSTAQEEDFDDADDDDDDDARAKPPPGPINNHDLCIAGFPNPKELRRDLNENEDYALIPGPVYDLLDSWYGGGPSLERYIVKVSDGYIVDIFPLRVEVIAADPRSGLEPSGVAWSSGTNGGTVASGSGSGVGKSTEMLRAAGPSQPQQNAALPEALHFVHSSVLEEFHNELVKCFGGRDPKLARLWLKQGESLSTPVGGDPNDPGLQLTTAVGKAADDGWVLLKLGKHRRQRLDAWTQDCDVVRVLVERRGKASDSWPRGNQAGGGGKKKKKNNKDAYGAGEPGGEGKEAGPDSEEDDDDDEEDDDDDDEEDDEDMGGEEGGGGVVEEDPRWRQGLAVGSAIDALDSDMRWFDAKIVEVSPPGTGEDKVKVHYMGWTPKWDVWVNRGDREQMAPLHTHTENWREALGKGDELEVSDKVFTNSRRNTWHPGKILTVKAYDDGERKVLVRVESTDYDDAWVSMRGEFVCNLGTHTKRPRSSATSGALSTPGGLNSAGSGSNGSSSYLGYSPWSRGSVSGSPVAVGAVGLSNLGNTCFMNSMLQCLFQAGTLSEYFLAQEHKKDLNKDNVLGTGGRLAVEYAALLKKLWSGSYSTVVPKEFKGILSRAAPQFAGYQQHDSQEFMSFLMDGIHEDLNRVKKKPYVENIEGGDGKHTDEEVATEAWTRHLKRNDSVIVDKCQGLLKSHLTCPACNHQSVTFDPYMSLSLPLPSARNVKGGRLRKIWVTVVPAVSAKSSKDLSPRAVELGVPMNGTIADIRAAVLEASAKAAEEDGAPLLDDPSLHPSKLRVCDMWSSRVYKVYKSSERVVEIRASDETYVYEVAHSALRSSSTSSSGSFSTPTRAGSGAGSGAGVRYVDVLMAREYASGGGRGGGGGGSSRGKVSSATPTPFGAPWHFSYDASMTVGAVRSALDRHCARMCDGLGRGARASYRVVLSDSEGKDLGAELSNSSSSSSSSSSSAGSGGGGSDRQSFADWLEAAAAVGSPSPGQSGSVYGSASRRGSKSQAQLPRALTVLWAAEARLSREGQEGWRKPPANSARGGRGAGGGGSGSGSGADVVQLADCLKLFTEKEQLGENDLWYCPKCKDHVPAFKKFDLWSLPDVLIVHLKRFEYIPGQYFMAREKIESLVSFPIQNLDLREFTANSGGSTGGAGQQFDLFAVSEHMGTQHGGHYTAVVKNYRNGQWYSCNDSSVSEVNPESGVTPNAYVLFYQRRGAPARWGGMKQSSNPSFAKAAAAPPGSAKGGKAKATGGKGRR